ncbi:PriCT-2 domain-containing protein [Aquisalimonas sp.]|uniref:PriCT-2 domain-containing protein n=1 Tax=Aquisalimonas sp. TaxID=1872621 RepID=UPI0025C0F11C|nr:PriCT-2 domain-containing protein [Aquisalimonas sp.]
MTPITILRTRHPALLATKVHRRTADGIETAAYGNARTFDAHLAEVESVFELATLLRRLATDPRAFVVRGIPKPGRSLHGINRRVHGEDADLMPHPEGLHWIKVDMDGQPMPVTDAVEVEGELITGVRDPKAAVRSVVEAYLPAYFQAVTAFYQFSSSAGVKPWSETRLGLWYYLDRPIPDRALHDCWAKRVPAIDPAVYVSSQPNYTAAPIFEGMADPCAGWRQGLILGDRHELCIPGAELQPIRTAPKVSEAERARWQAALADADGELERALGYISADDRETWIRVGMALKADGQPFSVWDAWSRTSGKYDATDAERVWKSLDPSDITSASVFYLAKQAGYEPAVGGKPRGRAQTLATRRRARWRTARASCRS